MKSLNRIALFSIIIFILTLIISCGRNRVEIRTKFTEEEYNIKVAQRKIYRILTLSKEENNFFRPKEG